MKNASFLTPIFTGAVTAVVIVVTVIVTSRVTGPLPLAVSSTVTEKQDTFNVRGESKIETAPDEARVNLGITVIQSSVAEAQNEANTIINDIAEELRKIGVSKESIQTQDYSISPQYGSVPSRENNLNPSVSGPGSRDDSRQITSYQVSTTLEITISDFDTLNQAIDVATVAGANQVGGIQFRISDQKEEELLKQAREEAIADARENARELAELAGMQLGKVVNVSEGTGYAPIAYSGRADMAFAEAASEPTRIEPGSTSYTYSVTMSYETL